VGATDPVNILKIEPVGPTGPSPAYVAVEAVGGPLIKSRANPERCANELLIIIPCGWYLIVIVFL